MQFRLPSKWSFVIFSAALALLLYFRHKQLLDTPYQYLISDSFDGYRGVMSAIYHVKWDSTYRHYEGQHYPYGDGLSFADGFPLLTNPVKFLSGLFRDLSQDLPGIVNLFMIFSFFLAGIFLFLIFKKLGLPAWYGGLAAIGIVFLSPQQDRLDAHYALAFAFILPALIYLTLRQEEKANWKNAAFMALILYLSSKFHFYHFAIGGFYVGAYFFFKILRSRSIKREVLYLFVALGLPTFLILLSQQLDPIQDRSSWPYGFFAYRGFFESIFINQEANYGAWYPKNLIKGNYIDYEGMGYVGAVATFFLLAALIQPLSFRPLSRFLNTEVSWKTSFFANCLLASIAALLFAVGFPFSLSKTGEDWLQYLGPLRQFRSIGRFSWICFYGFNILAFFSLFQWSKRLRKPVLKGLLLFVPLLLLGLEAHHYSVINKRYRLEKVPWNRPGIKIEDQTWTKNIDFPRYQAMVVYPFFHIGSENFWVGPFGDYFQKSLWLSTDKGLPMVNIFMARTSLEHTFNAMQFVNEPVVFPQLARDLPNDKPILVICYKSFWKDTEEKYSALLEKLPVIFENEEVKILEWSPSVPEQILSEKIEAVQTFLASDSLKSYPPFLTSSNIDTLNFHYEGYDNTLQTYIYQGEGAFSGPGKNANVLFAGSLPNQKAGHEYVVSFWIYLAEDHHPRAKVFLQEVNTEGNEIQRADHSVRNLEMPIHRGWGLVEFPITLKRADSRIKIMVENKDLRKKKLYCDELLIRPEGTDLYKKGMGFFLRIIDGMRINYEVL